MCPVVRLKGVATGLLVLALGSNGYCQDLSHAVVRIFSVRPGSTATSLGAGVFISERGDVLTAYHVIQGASSVDIYSDSKKCVDVQLIAYDEAQDLAHLNCKLNGGPSVYAEIGAAPARLSTRSGEALGFPEGKPLSHVPVNFLQDEAIRGEQYYVEGKQIFASAAWKIGLLNIDATLPPGMSGAPVVLDGRVIAIVSGSEELRSRAPGWAMIAANEKHLKRAADTRRFDNTPKLTMLLDPYSGSKSPLLKMALGGAAAQRLILADERLEELRVSARALDTRYGALLDRLPRSFEPGPNSVIPGTYSEKIVYGKLAENAISAADEYKGIHADYVAFVQDMAVLESDTTAVWDETDTELNGVKFTLTPEILQQLIEFMLLRKSSSDLADAMTQHLKTEVASAEIIAQIRSELLQLVANAPKDPVRVLLEALKPPPPKVRKKVPVKMPGCAECSSKSFDLLSAVAARAMRERLDLGELLAESGVAQRAARLLVQMTSAPVVLAAKQ